MYLFINENEVVPYNGEILKRYIGKRLVKTISNPTDEQLIEFGYKPLVEGETPEYDEETQALSYTYADGADEINKVYTVIDITTEEGE